MNFVFGYLIEKSEESLLGMIFAGRFYKMIYMFMIDRL